MDTNKLASFLAQLAFNETTEAAVKSARENPELQKLPGVKAAIEFNAPVSAAVGGAGGAGLSLLVGSKKNRLRNLLASTALGATAGGGLGYLNELSNGEGPYAGVVKVLTNTFNPDKSTPKGSDVTRDQVLAATGGVKPQNTDGLVDWIPKVLLSGPNVLFGNNKQKAMALGYEISDAASRYFTGSPLVSGAARKIF